MNQPSVVHRTARATGTLDDGPIEHGVLTAIGQTPLVRLARLFADVPFSVYAKLEGLNPGGSIKDRAAIGVLTAAWREGRITADTTVIESSSGNMGIGIAQACAYLGVRFVCVVDPKTTQQNIRILQAYGAEIDVVSSPDPVTGEFLPARLARVQALSQSIPDSFWLNQYGNLQNARAHHHTMHEIVEALDGTVDYLFCATSTCGTLRGCAEYIAARRLPTTVIAVDAEGSVIFGSSRGRRLIPGHGAAVRPALFASNLASRCVHVTDRQCVIGCRRLVQREAILAGGSSGAVIMALDMVRREIEPGSVCAVILPDRGERYLDTIYSDEWVEQHFGMVPFAFERPRAEECASEVQVAT